MKLTNLIKTAALVACACIIASKASAISLPAFFAANPNVAGVIDDAVPFGDDARVVYVNYLLSLGANANSTSDGERFMTGPTDYNGTVTKLESQNGTGQSSVSGWDYLFVKYDGPNAGAIVYVLNGDSFNIAANMNGLVTPTGATTTKTWNGGVSGWTLYGAHSTPDGGSTLALVGLAMAGLGLARRKLS